MLHEKISTKEFWFKNRTKAWLLHNTTFDFPLTYISLRNYDQLFEAMPLLPEGSYLLKSNIGRQSLGVINFDKIKTGYTLPTKDFFPSVESFKKEIKKIAVNRYKQAGLYLPSCRWFVEELVKPAKFLAPFTDDMKYPPVFRFCGRPSIHFIGISTMRELKTGLSGARWQQRQYVWVDLDGKVRHPKELPLEGVDDWSKSVVAKKSDLNPPVGLTIPGVPRVVQQINEEIVPKIKLFQNKTWSCDGVFNQQEQFIVFELNHQAGLRFVGFKW